jgi:hypothetical protein
MTGTSAVTPVGASGRLAEGADRNHRPGRNGARSLPVEIPAPDGYRAAQLVRAADECFPVAQVVPGTSIVRLEPPNGPAWVPELLSIVQDWLESAGIPCVTLFYGGRPYPISATAPVEPFAGYGGRISPQAA